MRLRDEAPRRRMTFLQPSNTPLKTPSIVVPLVCDTPIINRVLYFCLLFLDQVQGENVSVIDTKEAEEVDVHASVAVVGNGQWD